jgi:hypothetical protein
VERGQRAGAFLEEGAESGPEEVEETNAGPDFSSHDMLVEWFEETKPSAREVVNAAEGDGDKADMLLSAEETATGGHPRKTVLTALNRIIDAANAEDAEAEDEEEVE